MEDNMEGEMEDEERKGDMQKYDVKAIMEKWNVRSKNKDTDQVMRPYYWVNSGKIRLEVLLRLYMSEIPLSAQDIFNKVDDISMSSASHILTKLEDKKEKFNLVKRVDSGGNRNRFFEITRRGRMIVEMIPESTFNRSFTKLFIEMGFKVSNEVILNGKGLIYDMIATDGKSRILIEIRKMGFSNQTINRIKDTINNNSIQKAIIITLMRVDENTKKRLREQNIEVWDSRELDKLGRLILQ